MRPLVTLLIVLAALGSSVRADVRLPRIFTDHMIIQQEKPIRVWGWADPAEAVRVTFNERSAAAAADANGRWSVEFPAMPVDGKEHALTVTAANTITLSHLKLGEVWIAAGQSNMNRSIDVSKEDRPDLRLYWIDFSRTPQNDDLNSGVAGWVPSTEAGLASAAPHSEGRQKGKPRKIFSEVGYVFARRLHEELEIPVGVMRAAVGGSQARAWTPCPTDFPSQHAFGEEVPKKPYLGHMPGLLYYSMIKGIGPLGIRGVVWYQGENDGRSHRYTEDLTALIKSWRTQFRQDAMPFYFVQIAQTTYASGMLGVWEAQQKVMHTVPHTGLAVSGDIYDGAKHGYAPAPDKVDKGTGWPIAGGSNPHPPNKQLVANRLANIALEQTYGRKVGGLYGPMIDSCRIDGDEIVVTFRYVGSGLKTRDGSAPNWFEVSDGTREGRRLKYVKANAKIVGKDAVAVSADGVAEPKFVRFGWHPLVYANLINSAGLPAVSFRTDGQPGHAR